MADYNKLNDAKLSKFNMIFRKNQEISNAILELVRTAYADHHEEEKERRKRLVECLFERFEIIVGQLSNETFKDKLKEKITSIVKNDKGFTDKLKAQIEKDLQDAIDEVSKKQETQNTSKNKTTSKTEFKKSNFPSNNELIDKVFSNKKFVKNITDFTNSIIKKNNNKRLTALKKVFTSQKLPSFGKNSNKNGRKNTKISIGRANNLTRTHTQKKTSTDLQVNKHLVNKVTSGFGNLVKSFIDAKINEREETPLIILLQEKLSEKISGTVNYFKHTKYHVLRGIVTIKKNLNPKGLLKLTKFLLLGPLKFFKTLVFGFFKGLFFLVRKIFKLGINIVKSTFRFVKKTVSSIYKASKKITKNLFELTRGFLSKIMMFFLTPQGAYLIGFVAGFLFVRITGAFEWIKKKYEGIRDSIHERRMKLVRFIRTNEKMRQIKRLHRFTKNMRSFEVKMGLLKRDLDKLTSRETIFGAVGGGIGATMGKVIGLAVSAMFPPLAPFLPGITTALGAIAGYYIGKAFGSIKEEDWVKKSEDTNLIRAITGKYRQKKTSVRSKTRDSLQDKISQIEERLNDKSISGEERSKLEGKKRQYQRALDNINVTMTIDDEDAETRHHRQEKIDQIMKLLNLEQSEGLLSGSSRESIFKFPERLPSSGIDFGVDSLFNGDVGLSKIPDFPGRLMLDACRLLSRIKVLSLGEAINAYQKGLISFDDISKIANKQIVHLIDSVKFRQYTDRERLPDISLKDFLEITDTISSGRIYTYGAYDAWQQKDTVEDISEWIKSDIQTQESIIKDLTEKYIKIARSVGAPEEFLNNHKGVIEAYMRSFVRKNDIERAEQITNEMLRPLWNNITEAISLTDVDIQEPEKEGSLFETGTKAMLKMSKMGVLKFTDEQDKQHDFEVEQALTELGDDDEEKDAMKEDERIFQAKQDLAVAKAKYKVKFNEVMKKCSNRLVVPVETEKEPDVEHQPNLDSGVNQQHPMSWSKSLEFTEFRKPLYWR